jgi:hypothetical protein
MLSDINIIDLIRITEEFMLEANIPFRDTWLGVNGNNLDDLYINGKLGGQRHIKVIQKEDGISQIGAFKKYQIPNYNCVAYDSFLISIPKRLYGLRHPIIHEIVHFLQYNTYEQDNKYIPYNGNNFFIYVSQREEIEAYYVQLLYIEKHELELLEIDESCKAGFRDMLLKSITNKNLRPALILFSKANNIV